MIHAEIDRLMPEGALAKPPRPLAGASWSGKGEWDWFYALAPADRRRVLRHCVAGGLAPDECARPAGFDDIDQWATALVAAVVGSDRVDKWGDARTAEQSAALVGPVEIAELCGVKTLTVYQWVTRNRLPQPWAIVSGTRIWVREDIEEWATTTGRLAKSSADDF